PGSLYLAGLITRDKKMRDTAMFAGQAAADAFLLSMVIKGVTRRVRPVDIPPNGDFGKTFFQSDRSFLSVSGGFPSGHTISAFAIATVIARRYGNHRWVPV